MFSSLDLNFAKSEPFSFTSNPEERLVVCTMCSVSTQVIAGCADRPARVSIYMGFSKEPRPGLVTSVWRTCGGRVEVCPRVDEVGRETSPHADLRSGRIHGSGRQRPGGRHGRRWHDGSPGRQHDYGITPAHPRLRQPTGLPALDAILCGGFPVGALSQVRLVSRETNTIHTW